MVISRYHKIDGYDWIAIPLIPYLYAVDSVNDVPMSVDKAQVAAIRDKYRQGASAGACSGQQDGWDAEGRVDAVGGGVVRPEDPWV